MGIIIALTLFLCFQFTIPGIFIQALIIELVPGGTWTILAIIGISSIIAVFLAIRKKLRIAVFLIIIYKNPPEYPAACSGDEWRAGFKGMQSPRTGFPKGL